LDWAGLLPVVTNLLDPRFEKVALSLKDLANALEVEKDCAFFSAPKEDVADYLLGAKGANGLGVAFGEESVPFCLARDDGEQQQPGWTALWWKPVRPSRLINQS
jgi:hypothetical protein